MWLKSPLVCLFQSIIYFSQEEVCQTRTRECSCMMLLTVIMNLPQTSSRILETHTIVQKDSTMPLSCLLLVTARYGDKLINIYNYSEDLTYFISLKCFKSFNHLYLLYSLNEIFRLPTTLDNQEKCNHKCNSKCFQVRFWLNSNRCFPDNKCFLVK